MGVEPSTTIKHTKHFIIYYTNILSFIIVCIIVATLLPMSNVVFFVCLFLTVCSYLHLIVYYSIELALDEIAPRMMNTVFLFFLFSQLKRTKKQDVMEQCSVYISACTVHH